MDSHKSKRCPPPCIGLPSDQHREPVSHSLTSTLQARGFYSAFLSFRSVPSRSPFSLPTIVLLPGLPSTTMPPKRSAGTAVAAAPNKRRRASDMFRSRANPDPTVQPRQTRSRAALPGASPLVALAIDTKRRRPRAPRRTIRPKPEPVIESQPSPVVFPTIEVPPAIETQIQGHFEDLRADLIQPSPTPNKTSPSRPPSPSVSTSIDIPAYFERESAPSPDSIPGSPELPDYSDSDSEDAYTLVPFNSRKSRGAPATWHHDFDRPKFDEKFSFECRAGPSSKNRPLPSPELPNIDPAVARGCDACGQHCGGTYHTIMEQLVGEISPRTVVALPKFPIPEAGPPERRAGPQSADSDGVLIGKRKLSSISKDPTGAPSPSASSKRTRRSSSSSSEGVLRSPPIKVEQVESQQEVETSFGTTRHPSSSSNFGGTSQYDLVNGDDNKGDDDRGTEVCQHPPTPALSPSRMSTASSISDIELDVNLDLQEASGHGSASLPSLPSPQTSHYFGDDEREGQMETAAGPLELPAPSVDVQPVGEKLQLPEQQLPQSSPPTPQPEDLVLRSEADEDSGSAASSPQKDIPPSQSTETVIPGLFTLYPGTRPEVASNNRDNPVVAPDAVEVIVPPPNDPDMTESGYMADDDHDMTDVNDHNTTAVEGHDIAGTDGHDMTDVDRDGPIPGDAPPAQPAQPAQPSPPVSPAHIPDSHAETTPDMEEPAAPPPEKGDGPVQKEEEEKGGRAELKIKVDAGVEVEIEEMRRSPSLTSGSEPSSDGIEELSDASSDASSLFSTPFDGDIADWLRSSSSSSSSSSSCSTSTCSSRSSSSSSSPSSTPPCSSSWPFRLRVEHLTWPELPDWRGRDETDAENGESSLPGGTSDAQRRWSWSYDDMDVRPSAWTLDIMPRRRTF